MSKLIPSKIDTLDEHPSEAHLEVHPAIELLVARMRSHPQEFYHFATVSGTQTNGNRVKIIVGQSVEPTKSLWNRKEKRLFNLALREVRLAELHSRLMHGLLT